MANLDWSQCPAVESIPGKVSGAWVFRDTRMPVSIVFENLESGASIEEIVDWFHVTREQIVAVLEFAARSLDPPPPRCAAISRVTASPKQESADGNGWLTATCSTRRRRRGSKCLSPQTRTFGISRT